MTDTPELDVSLQEWIKAYLKANLSVRVDCRQNYDYYSNGIVVDVELHLDGDLISDSSDSFDFPSHS